jgi:L-lysine exporter family protein LysE/ArgO
MWHDDRIVRSFWTGYLLSISLCMDLGIVNVATIRVAITQGPMPAFLMGVGSCAGDLIYFTLAALGAATLAQWTPVRWGLWLFGTAVLLYLAWKMAREVIHPRQMALQESQRQSHGSLLLSGMGLALASPTAILWFAAVGGSVIASFGGDRGTLLPFAAGFAAGGLTWAAMIAFGAAALRGSLGRPVIRTLSLISAILFLYFAATVFIQGLRTI